MIDGIGEVFTPFAQLRGDIYGVGGVDNQALNGSPEFVSEDAGQRRDVARQRASRASNIAIRSSPRTGSVDACLRADRPDHRQTKLVGQSAGHPQRGRAQPRVRRHPAVRHRQVLRLRPHRDRHARQCRRALHRATRRPALMPAPCSARAISSPGENEYDTDFFRSSGLATDRSDFVGGLYIQALSNLGFSAQSRFDESTWDIKRTDLGTSAHYGPAQGQGQLCRRDRRARAGSRSTTRGNFTAGVLALTETGLCSAICATISRPSRPSPTAWACVPGRLLDAATSPISGPSSKTRTSNPIERFLVELCAEISRQLFQSRPRLITAARSAPSGSDTNN